MTLDQMKTLIIDFWICAGFVGTFWIVVWASLK